MQKNPDYATGYKPVEPFDPEMARLEARDAVRTCPRPHAPPR
jgi:hypothetical protein